MKNITDSVFCVVKLIPKGTVATYSQIARRAGVKSPRSIGAILHSNQTPDTVPCHRVVKSDGRLAEGYAFGGKAAQRAKLEREGIVFTGNSLKLQKYLWKKSLRVPNHF